MSDVKRYWVPDHLAGGNPAIDRDATEVVVATAYDAMKEAYEMMDLWFSDSMTQNQVDIIDAILSRRT